MTILVGNIIKVEATFVNKQGARRDPADVFVEVKKPSGEILEYAYLIGSEIQRESRGVYYINVNTTGQLGNWEFVWTSKGTYHAVGQTEFEVVDTIF